MQESIADLRSCGHTSVWTPLEASLPMNEIFCCILLYMHSFFIRTFNFWADAELFNLFEVFQSQMFVKRS